MSGTGARPASTPPGSPAGSRHAAPDEPGHGRRHIDSAGTGQHSRELPRGPGPDPAGQHSREFRRGPGGDATGQQSRAIPGPDAAGQHSRELPRGLGADTTGQHSRELPRPARPDTGTGAVGQHSREIPRPGPRDTGTGRAAVRPAGSGRPVSPMPGSEGTLFGSRNTTAGRARPGAAAPEGYPGGRRGATGGATDGDGWDGTAERSGPIEPAGRQPTGPVRNRPGQWSGMAPAAPAKAAAVVPPVVPGPSGVRTPAVPGRAGAMADSPSGVIQRPGGTTGNVPDRTTGRVPRPGRAAPRLADTGQVRRADTGQVRPASMGRVRPADTGQVRPAATGAIRPADTGAVQRADIGQVRPSDTAGVRRTAPPPATGRATGAVPAPVLDVPSEQPDDPARTGTWADGRPGAGPVTATADFPSAEPAATVPPRTRSGTPGLLQRIRTERGLRVVALVTLSVVVLLLLPLAFGIRAATRDPVLRSLDALDVPGWAAHNVDDRSSGSRWCFLDCRFRERTAQSERSFADTQKAYAAALTTAGWRRWNVSGCPDQPISPQDGRYSCWRRDEFTLDLWVRLPECAVDAVAAQDPAALPSTGPDGVVPTTIDPRNCTGSTVSIKVQNAITDQRGRPGGEKPGLTGETPDPVLSDDPLLEPTPAPS